MLSSDDTTRNTGSIERIPRPFNHRDAVNERRHNILQQKQTDSMPGVHVEALNGRIAWRQLIQLREENKRLRWLLAEAGKSEETVPGNHSQEIEHYRYQVHELLEEQNRLQEAYRQLEHRFQEQYHTFRREAEEEAHRMVADAAHTIELTPENRPDRPAAFHDIMKTVEFHVRQAQDKHTAEALYLMRQAQRKAAKLEYELTQERQQIATERQNLHNLQTSAREQAELRKRIVGERLRAQYTLTLTIMTTFFLLLLPIFQLIAYSFIHLRFTPQIVLALFAPLLVCMVLVAIFSYIRSSTRIISHGMPQKKVVQTKNSEKGTT
ncbi:MAG: hypothetical protein NVSMB33_13710 [Ktedonobacteraceae bacterium]